VSALLDQAEVLGAADPEAALDHVRRATPLADLDADLHWRIGRALRRLGRPDEAADALRRALLLDPTLWPAAFQLGGALFEAGRHDEAAREYARTRRLLEGSTVGEPLERADVDEAARRRIEACQRAAQRSG
jgi:tetratricopeptide (TPR) repeat protein